MEEAPSQELQAMRAEILKGGEVPDVRTVTAKLRERGIAVPLNSLRWVATNLLGGGRGGSGENFVPSILLEIIPRLLEGQRTELVCDPWAGIGVLAANVQGALQARRVIAFNPSPESVALGRLLTPRLEWHVGNPIPELSEIPAGLDAVVSILPMGGKIGEGLDLKDPSGVPIRLSGSLGPLILAGLSTCLAEDGVGIFVVTPSFFGSSHSTLPHLPSLGLGVEAAFELPAGTFAPVANVAAILAVIRRHVVPQMFVARLTKDIRTNGQVLDNYRARRVDGIPQMGRMIAPEEFQGIAAFESAEEIQRLEERFASPAVRLEKISLNIQLGRPGVGFAFKEVANAIYVPLAGEHDVVDTIEELALKQQSYAQVAIDSQLSDARFVARFLNTDLGRHFRLAQAEGATTPRLNSRGLREIRVVVPTLESQAQMLGLESRIESERNTLLGLQNDLNSIHRDLWTGRADHKLVDSQIQNFSKQWSVGAKPSLEQWFESLPFPLASILRAWQATSDDDYKTRCDHLLHFFEATAEFLGIILLSAFSSDREFFAGHREGLVAAWSKQNLTLERATFGTWKVTIEFLGKRTRELLSADAPEQKAICAVRFSDPSLGLPRALARTELADVLSKGVKFRNDSSHGGIIAGAEARLRHEKLLSEVQRLREVMEGLWDDVQMVRCLQCKPRRGMFDNEVAILKGSNSEFLKEIQPMPSWLDVEQLYLLSLKTGHALKLLPLLQVGASPPSAKNACYFFNRLEKGGIRFVSYHFVDQPERTEKFEDTASAILELTRSGPTTGAGV